VTLADLMNANPGAVGAIGAAAGGFAGGLVAGSRRVRKLEKRLMGKLHELMEKHERECLRRGWPTLTPPLGTIPLVRRPDDG
jgi:hypothetical protein